MRDRIRTNNGAPITFVSSGSLFTGPVITTACPPTLPHPIPPSAVCAESTEGDFCTMVFVTRRMLRARSEGHLLLALTCKTSRGCVTSIRSTYVYVAQHLHNRSLHHVACAGQGVQARKKLQLGSPWIQSTHPLLGRACAYLRCESMLVCGGGRFSTFYFQNRSRWQGWYTSHAV